MRTVLRRLASFVRHAGGFAPATDMEAVKRSTKAVVERVRRLDAVEARLDEIRRQNRELRREVVRLRKLIERADIRGLGERIRRSHGALDKGFQAVRRDSRTERKRLDRVESQVRGVLRALYLRDEAPEYPHRVTVQRFGLLSQHEEDGITAALLRAAGSQWKRFVEIGCSDHGQNTGFLAEDLGWSGLMVDRDAAAVAVTRQRFPEAAVRTVVAVVTPATIDELLRTHGFAAELDVLSIDIDGNDYWVWKALGACQPRLVIIEYNPVFGPDRAVVVPYDEDRRSELAQQHRYFGASLRAMQTLALGKGYRLVAVEPDSANAFFLRHDVGPSIPAIAPERVFRTQRKHWKVDLRQVGDIFATCAAHDLPLIDVSTSEGAPPPSR